MGRNKSDNPKKDTVVLRATKQEKDAIKDEARKKGLSVSALIINQVLGGGK